MFFNDRMVAAMITLGDFGRINLYQLAKRSHTNRTYVGNLVRRMESLGLVTIEEVEGRKPVYVEPTKKGKKVAIMLKESSRRIWDEISIQGDQERTTSNELVMDLSPRFSLILGPGLDEYSLRVATPDGSFSFNADLSKSKLRELQRGIESILDGGRTRSTSGKSPRKRKD